jgi:hypothetical protein
VTLATPDWKNARAFSTLDPARRNLKTTRKNHENPFNRVSERPFLRNPSDFPGTKDKIRASPGAADSAQSIVSVWITMRPHHARQAARQADLPAK